MNAEVIVSPDLDDRIAAARQRLAHGATSSRGTCD